jgi:predicted GIY-YIG superfamily endonuclease
MSRAEFRKRKDYGALNLAGVYVIYSTTSVDSGIYIGEGDDVRTRLKFHDSDKGFWDELLIFTSSRMNVAFAKNIEYQFIKRAKLSSKYPLYNGVSGGKRKLGEEDRNHLKDHLMDFYRVISLANIDIFDVNPDVIYKLHKWGHNFDVKVLNLDKKLIRVLAGSIIGAAFSFRAKMDGIDYVKLADGDYQIKIDVDLELNSDHSKIFGQVSTMSIKNDHGMSLCAVLESAIG